MLTDNRLDQNYLKKLTVLYVEDDDDTREQFTEFLSRPVGRLITSANGAEGLEAFIKYSPDIVVTDILMPKMDGLTMCYEIRGLAPNVPIIVITAFEQTDYLMRAIDIGVHRYVTKPVNSYLLFGRLLECAHRLRAEEQLKYAHQREIQAVWSKHNEALALLAGGLAHDYNNLLNGILGFFSVAKTRLEELNEGIKYLDYIDECYSQANDLSRLLHILASTGHDDMEYDEVLSFIRLTLDKSLAGTQITVTVDFAEDLPSIKFGSHMDLVFSALADNALEAMPSGGTLTLAGQMDSVTEFDSLPLAPGNYLHISLTDTGCGIHPEVLPKIFEPYFSTKQRCSKHGMGLSLALCQTIIMKHGGIINAESTLGSGATFHVRLPVAGQTERIVTEASDTRM